MTSRSRPADSRLKMATVVGQWIPGTCTVLIWNADDVVKLRREWRIVGSLIGQDLLRSPAGGLPLMLNQYEATLLVKEGVLEVCVSGATPEEAVKWPHPQNEEELRRFAVFCDLWRKGHYLTSGVKFGGDFLAYSGDPALYHAHSIVLVLSPGEEVTAKRLAAHSRVGSNAKKRVLWSSVDGSGQPFYFTQWWGGRELNEDEGET